MDEFILGDINDPTVGTPAADGSQRENFIAAMRAYRDQGPAVWDDIREFLRRHNPEILKEVQS